MLFLLWGAGWLWFATSLSMSFPEKESVKTDAIIVLTGGKGRINTGLDLLSKKAAPKLFISGVHENVSKKDLLSRWKKPEAKEPCCISLGYEAKDTFENAIEVQKWVTGNNINSVRLVTSSYHMPRAYMQVSALLPETTIIRHPITSDDFQPWKDRFWSLSFAEYNKILFVWLKLGQGNKKETAP